MIKHGLVLGVGNCSAAILGLLRNVLIARLLSVEDFGIAATFAITVALTEMTSTIAVNRLIVQARDGETPLLQSTVQAIQAAWGAVLAAGLFALAGPIASLFGVPDAAWAYRLMAAIPLIRGLAHLDMYRFQRGMRFLPSVSVECTAQCLSTAAAVPLALWLGDYRAMLYALLAQQLTFTLATHAVASRRYSWACDRQIVGRAVAFGWPLLFNGLLMFGTFHGDRVIVGSQIGLTELGWYSAAFTLTLMPTLVIGKTLQTYFLPQLAPYQDDAVEFRRRYLLTVQAELLVGVSFAVVVAMVGPAVLIALYGTRYEAALSILVWLAVMQSLRMAKAGPAVVALAKGETTNPLIANLARVLMLPVAWAAASLGAGVQAIVGLAIAGECLAVATSFALLRRRLGLPFVGLRVPLVAASSALALIFVVSYTNEAGIPSDGYLPSVDALIYLAVLPPLLWAMPAVREWGKSFLRDFAARRREPPSRPISDPVGSAGYRAVAALTTAPSPASASPSGSIEPGRPGASWAGARDALKHARADLLSRTLRWKRS